MKRQRCAERGVLGSGILKAFVLLVLAVPAGAVSLSVDRAYVSYKGDCSFTATIPPQFICPRSGLAAPPADYTGGDRACPNPNCGNISNEAHIEFESDYLSVFQNASPFCATPTNAIPNTGTIAKNYCNDAVFLCSAIGYRNELTTSLNLDEMKFEVFKFQDGANALDAGSTPPIRTFFVDNPGTIPALNTGNNVAGVGKLTPTCVLFDGASNIQGDWGKTNGQYGFRITVRTQVQGQSGNIQITAERAYPSGATQDATSGGNCPATGCFVSQKPITVDVTNIHVLTASATIVGNITGVTAQPYNLSYRLSKDATMYINIHNSVTSAAGSFPVVRKVVPGLPRSGEGVPKGTLLNGDSWNGRFDNGDFGPPGVYLASFQAFSDDQYGRDLSFPVTRQIGLDVVHVTDLRVLPLQAGSTSLAVLTYELTEPATVYVDIYAPNTQFCRADGLGLNSVNAEAMDQPNEDLPLKVFGARLSGACTNTDVINPVRSIKEVKESRKAVVSFWDGRDKNGNVLPDGDYVFVIYAALASQNGFKFCRNGANAACASAATEGETRIWSSQAKTGFLPIIRGFVGLFQITPASSIAGSSPTVAALNPFFFRYQMSRDAVVNLRVFDRTGTKLVKTIVADELRPGTFSNQDTWSDAADNTGQIVSSGTYLIQLTAADPLFPAKVSTTTALFPVNLYRITDLLTTPLLSGASDTVVLNYQLTQTMRSAWNIYPPGTVITNSTGTWPPCNAIDPTNCAQTVGPTGQIVNPVITFKGLRTGRQKYTEIWDGRDSNGLFVPDGSYVYTLTAESTASPKYYATDKIMGNITVARGAILFTSFSVKPEVPALFNSSSTITLHPFSIEYALTRQSSVTIQILTAQVPATLVRTVVAGGIREAGILNSDVWDGRDNSGNFPRSGFYNVRVVAEDLASVLSSGSTSQLTVTFEPLRIYDLAISPLRGDNAVSVISYQISEPMKISLKVYKPGTIFDVSGNPSPPESVSLVKRIVGNRPARTPIEETWDGTDLRQSIVVDGNYKFKLVGSTDPAAIDSLTGNVLNSAALSLDRPIDEIPVVRNGSFDIIGAFENNTFLYPNPAKGNSARFTIFSPIQGKVRMKLYNIAGEVVLDKDFGEKDIGSYVNFDWNKVNDAGRPIGRGLYWAVIRIEETLGGRNNLQTVKKVLVP